MDKTMRVGRELLLWIGGGLGALCLLFLAAGWLFNVTPLVFASGSMSPAYEAGALGMAREVPAEDIGVGDVVSVLDAQGARVTHRVVDVQQEGGAAVLTLKGDTNDVVDVQTYTVSSVDRVSFGVPHVGSVLSAATSPAGLLLGGLLVVGSLWAGFGRREDDGPTPLPRRVRMLLPAGVVSAVAVGGVLGAAGAAPWAFTSAVWSDTATATTIATTPVGDVTGPSLTNPLPANNAVGATWPDIDCANSVAGINQLCVSATDAGGVASVTVKLVRTSSNQCWNGTSFIAGTGCAARPMSVLSAPQYRTLGLTATVMTTGTYTATYTATDGNGNVTTLSTTFGIIPRPVITTCADVNGEQPYTVNWSWNGNGLANPSSFRLDYGGGGAFRAPETYVGTARSGGTDPINNEAGTFRIVAIINGLASAPSNAASYSGNGNKNCSVSP